MYIKVLNQKPKILINDENYLDLSDNSFQSDDIIGGIIGIEYVDAKMEMRPDLISLKWYGDTKSIDILLKTNNIFNPFSILEGDMLVIPSIKPDTKVYKQAGTVVENEVRKDFIDTSRMSKNDITKLKSLLSKSKNDKDRLLNPLPPNMLAEGDSNKKYVDGQIILTNNK